MPKQKRERRLRLVILLERSPIHLYAWEYLILKRSIPGATDANIEFRRADPESESELLGVCLDLLPDLVYAPYEYLVASLTTLQATIERGFLVAAIDSEGKLVRFDIGATQGKSHLILGTKRQTPRKPPTRHRHGNPGPMGLDSNDGGRNDI